jgi:arginase family enzyme
MRLPQVVDLTVVDIELIGILYDGGTSSGPEARFGPREIREQSSLTHPYSGPQKTYPFDKNNVADCGDIDTAPTASKGPTNSSRPA